MIFKFLLDLLFGVVGLIVGLLPTLPSFSNLNVSLQPFAYVVSLVNQFIDLPMLGNCLLLVLAVYNARFIWSVLNWLIKKIPGIS